ncbi:hypothetical protein MNBD_GAMMA12-1269 [hydrothermal vent metagenome]|uniref:Uncharacterized protein n=1 Tax=hydrothermal vent metagenome TaxID=652676 RepID=A0A3B0YRL9_9ZZZZ
MSTRIGITQRVEVQYGERRDCLDQNWVSLLEQLDIEPIIISNNLSNPDDFFERLEIQGFILSGGNDMAHIKEAKNVAPERDQLEQALLRFAQSRALPVMGVCRGMQMINHFYGGQLSPLQGHVQTEHKITPVGDFNIISKAISVNSYHHYGIDQSHLADNLHAVACDTNDSSIEALISLDRRLLGIMWHPERKSVISESDKTLITRHFGIETQGIN